jgi:hypothetical protein
LRNHNLPHNGYGLHRRSKSITVKTQARIPA